MGYFYNAMRRELVYVNENTGFISVIESQKPIEPEVQEVKTKKSPKKTDTKDITDEQKKEAKKEYMRKWFQNKKTQEDKNSKIIKTSPTFGSDIPTKDDE